MPASAPGSLNPLNLENPMARKPTKTTAAAIPEEELGNVASPDGTERAVEPAENDEPRPSDTDGVTADPPPDDEDEPSTKTVPIPPDQVEENPEGLIAENGEVIKHTTQEVYDENPEAGTSEGNPPAEDPDRFENTSPDARENYDPERRDEIREAQARRGDAQMAEPRPELRRRERRMGDDNPDSAHIAQPAQPQGTFAQGGEDSDELQRLPNTPIEGATKPAAFDPNVKVGQQVDLATANRMAVKQSKQMNEELGRRVDGDTLRQLRRRGRSLV